MEQSRHATLGECLAWQVLSDPLQWLCSSKPTYVRSFLCGAEVRAQLLCEPIPRWRIYGPLEQRQFFQPIIDRTGHPNLSIKWATALEIIHLRWADGVDELRSLVQKAAAAAALDDGSNVYTFDADTTLEDRIGKFWKEFAERPGMYFGSGSGLELHCFLSGVDAGGDWLRLPEIPGFREARERLAQRSKESYGSEFAAFRVYEGDAKELIGWMIADPSSPKPKSDCPTGV